MRTFVLDLDGTVVDSLPDLLAACNRFAAGLGLAPFTADDVRPMIGDGAAALLHRAMAARGRQATEGDVTAFVADYMAHVADETVLYPGVAATLDALQAAGWHLAICTNKPEAPARAILDRLGVLGRFAAIGGGDSFPVRKPDPAHLLATIAAAGGRPDAALMVGDHRNDVMAASGAHVPSVFALWGYGPLAMAEGAAATAASFTDLPAIGARLLPG